MSKPIFLFDMDGTLTPPRKKIERPVIQALSKLSEIGEIGIVTGSDYDYLMQQCIEMFGTSGVPYSKTLLFPCNGTKYYKWGPDKKFILESESDMIEEIGREKYNYVIQTLLSFQVMISVAHNLPYTGTFFQYRGSMLNWCPIGRSAGDSERAAWVEADLEKGIRDHFLKQTLDLFKDKSISASAALGGSTSIDIYPEGWDKTFCLNHLDSYDNIYFVGDKCDPTGNDYPLYSFLESTGKSFVTSSPEETVAIIRDIILKEEVKT